MRRSLSLFLALLTVVGCTSPRTQVTVVVDSDLDLPAELDSVLLTVSSPSGTEQTSMGDLGSAAALPATLALVHQRGPLGPVRVRADGLAAGATVLSREAEFVFQPERTLVLRMFLTRDCVSVDCGMDETCEGGSCRSIFVDSDELTEWTGEPPRLDAGTPPQEDAGEPPPMDGGEPPTDASAPDAGTDSDAGVSMDGGVTTPDAGTSLDAGMMMPDAGPPDAGPPDGGPPDTGPPDTGPMCPSGSCGASCMCADGCDCPFTCGADQDCNATCSGSGTTCDLTGSGSGDVTGTCDTGATCTVSLDSGRLDQLSCSGLTTTCSATCAAGADRCVLDCADGAECTLACASGDTDCELTGCPPGQREECVVGGGVEIRCRVAGGCP